MTTAAPEKRRASWTKAFDRPSTTATTTGAAHRARPTPVTPYAADDGRQTVELAHAGDKLVFAVIVPEPGQFDRIAATLDPGLLAQTTTFTGHEVAPTLPKFDLSSSLSLSKQLVLLGIPTAFSDQADIPLDEQGTTGATATTATTATMTDAAAPVDVKTVTADRLFLYVLANARREPSCSPAPSTTRRSADRESPVVGACPWLDDVVGQLGVPGHVEQVDIAVGEVDDDPAARVAVVGLHPGVGPHHLFVGSVDSVVVAVVYVLAALERADATGGHLLEEI